MSSRKNIAQGLEPAIHEPLTAWLKPGPFKAPFMQPALEPAKVKHFEHDKYRDARHALNCQR